jgi:hypothetical protein
MQKYDFYYRKIQISYKYKMLMFVGEPLRAPFGCARVGLSAPSRAPPLRGFARGSAAIPLAKPAFGGLNMKYECE